MAKRIRRLSDLDRGLLVLGFLAIIACTADTLPQPVAFDQALLPDITMLAALLGFSWVLMQQRFPSHLLAILIGFLAVGLLYFISFLVSPNLIGIRNILGIVVSAVVFFFFERMGRTSAATKYGIAILVVSAFICVALGSLQKNTLSATASYMVMTAGILALRLYRSPLVVVSVIFPIVILIAVIMDHRTMIAMGFAGWATFVMLYFFPWGINRKAIILLAAGGIFLFFVLNIGMFGLNIRDYNALVIEYTGRNALSGRQLVWPALVKAVTSTDWGLWFGLGAGQTFSGLYESRLSAHNYYLQTFMQVGLIGVFTVVYLLYALWRATGRANRKEPLRHYMTAYLAIVIVHSATTVFLMQVNLTIAINAWAGLGIGLGMLARSAGPAPAGRRSHNQPRQRAVRPAQRALG